MNKKDKRNLGFLSRDPFDDCCESFNDFEALKHYLLSSSVTSWYNSLCSAISRDFA